VTPDITLVALTDLATFFALRRTVLEERAADVVAFLELSRIVATHVTLVPSRVEQLPVEFDFSWPRFGSSG
jgi:hypothetical protein